MEKNFLRSQEAKKITIMGFWINAVLTIFKIFAGIVGNSGAMVADGIHSLSDFLTDIVVLIGLKLTDKPEDDCHNYGHDKYETLATMIISIFLLVVGFKIMKSGVLNILVVMKGGVLGKPGYLALFAAIISIIVKELLYQFTIKTSEKINSPALKANAWHHRSDTFSSLGTLFGIGGAILLGDKWIMLDPIASLVVSIFIFKVSFDIFLPAINELMESALDKDEVGHIRSIIKNKENVISFHKLRTRRVGTKVVIETHILLESSINFKLAHEVATEIENEIKVSFGDDSIVTIHMEPNETYNKYK